VYVTFVEKSPAVAGQVDEEKELIIDFGFVSGYKIF